MHKIAFIFLLLFSACGIEVPQPIPRLYAPNGLRVENVYKTVGSTQEAQARLRLTWYGVNPELEFSGYNIYYTSNYADAVAFRGTKILCRQFNPRQATLVVRQPFDEAQYFDYEIKKFYYAGQGELFTEGTEYWFFIKAYNQTRNIESPPSMYASVVFEDDLN